MMMKHIVLDCTLPTAPYPANRGRYYYLPPEYVYSRLQKLHLEMMMKHIVPACLSPPPHSQLTGTEITTCPPEYVHSCLQKLHLEKFMKPIVLACTVPIPTTPFPANRSRDYYLPQNISALVWRSCIWKWWLSTLSWPVLSPPPIPCQQGQRLLPVHFCLQKLHLEMMM